MRAARGARRKRDKLTSLRMATDFAVGKGEAARLLAALWRLQSRIMYNEFFEPGLSSTL